MISKISIFLILWLVFTIYTTTQAGNIIYVDASKTTGGNNGTSWTNAYILLQSALSSASSGDQIWVAKGTYKPTKEVGGTGDRYKTFQMKDSVAIYGGFSGMESGNFDLSLRNFDNYETILSGDLNDDDVVTKTKDTLIFENNSENCYHVFYHPFTMKLTNAAILDGFTIMGGNAFDDEIRDSSGGGICNYYSSPTLTNLIIKDNSAYWGGGICNVSSPIISNVTIISNKARTGGGIYNMGSPKISDVKFISNIARYGGGIYNESSSSAIFKNTTFISNIASSGGGMSNWQSTPTIINAVFVSNKASGYSGAMNNLASSPTIVNTTISLNSAELGGAMSNLYHSEVILNNCIIWGNKASRLGNQFYISTGVTTLNYSCFANQDEDVFNQEGTEFDEKGIFSVTNNNIIINPEFVDADNNDFRISAYSPCVNAGNNSYNSENTEIRGEDRIQNSTIDMGAYEWTKGIDPGSVPFNLAVSDSIVTDGTGVCFDAENEITVAGSSIVTIENNASANFIAGSYIHFLPGFHAENGSFMDAHITTDGSFCDLVMASSSLVSNASNVKSLETLVAEKPIKEYLYEKLVKVYPNPNNGRFTVELKNFKNHVKITIVNMLGKTVYAPTTINVDRFEITMNNLPKGLYLLLLNDVEKVISEKIIVE